MLARIRNNLELKALSLLLAVGAWAYLRFSPNPVLAARFDRQMSVPVTVLGLRPGRVARFAEKQVDVAVSVPRDSTAAIRPEEVRAVLDLGAREVGAYNLPVRVIAPKLQIDSLSPASVTLTIERIEDRVAPVAVRYVGEGRGRVVVAGISTAPSSVVLRGPSSLLAQVRGVRVDVALPTSAGRSDAMLRPRALDAAGNDVAELVLSPRLVRVDARFVLGRGR